MTETERQRKRQRQGSYYCIRGYVQRDYGKAGEEKKMLVNNVEIQSISI
jgi:hypothetical protein